MDMGNLTLASTLTLPLRECRLSEFYVDGRIGSLGEKIMSDVNEKVIKIQE